MAGEPDMEGQAEIACILKGAIWERDASIIFESTQIIDRSSFRIEKIDSQMFKTALLERRSSSLGYFGVIRGVGVRLSPISRSDPSAPSRASRPAAFEGLTKACVGGVMLQLTGKGCPASPACISDLPPPDVPFASSFSPPRYSGFLGRI